MTNADPHELQKFSDLAHRWWDPNAEFKPLHDLNPVRLGWIDAHAHLAGKRALDIESNTAAALISALPAPNLPAHLGNTINTTA